MRPLDHCIVTERSVLSEATTEIQERNDERQHEELTEVDVCHFGGRIAIAGLGGPLQKSAVL